MIKSGIVIDARTREPIPYASIEITDGLGTYLGAGTSAGVDGRFALDSYQMQPGTFMRVSSVGYNTVSFTYDQYYGQNTFDLYTLVTTLPGVTITATKKPAEKDNTVIYVGAGLLALLLLLKKN